jgi:hypothetical protein
MINQTAEQFQKFATDYNNMVLEGWSAWTKQTIQSDAFTATTGAVMDWSLASQKMMTELSGQWMESMDIPKRSDLARISAQVQAVESRLLDQEDNQDELRDLLTTLIKKIDDMPAPVPVAPAAPKTEAAPATQEKATKKPAAKKRAASKSRTKSKAKAKKKTATAKASKKKESK